MKPPPGPLPDIEDATFLACLDPLAAALPPPAGWDPGLAPDDDPAWGALEPDHPPAPRPRLPPSGAAQPADAAAPPSRPAEHGTAPSLAAWRSQADEEFAEFRAVALFLAKTDAELATALQAHPRQMLGFLERLSRIQQRRTAQNQAMTALMARLHQAMLRVATDSGQPEPSDRAGYPRVSLA